MIQDEEPYFRMPLMPPTLTISWTGGTMFVPSQEWEQQSLTTQCWLNGQQKIQRELFLLDQPLEPKIDFTLLFLLQSYQQQTQILIFL
jgi:hypothetical protein